ncbi:hypothetical protein BS47DRAFT_592047 [Hydnum rufescens UP504]|uniref:Secreted protein n=1 Tax=Hydnum rufescens UP504 TaxID=1448309 RepID=A0A9P6B647_9AGAM|nr:hypothetical protein BS47DRAFT_592047 [Hydnum rufescens UP504]
MRWRAIWCCTAVEPTLLVANAASSRQPKSADSKCCQGESSVSNRTPLTASCVHKRKEKKGECGKTNKRNRDLAPQPPYQEAKRKNEQRDLTCILHAQMVQTHRPCYIRGHRQIRYRLRHSLGLRRQSHLSGKLSTNTHARP